MKKRLDTFLSEKGYFPSTSKARSAILAGQVFLNGMISDKPGKQVDESLVRTVEIREKERYVSRGGYKLEKALDDFCISVKNRICMDIGCSTGGFTDCLLQRHAGKVYAVDVGYGQFDYGLRRDPAVVLLEKQNIRYLDDKLIKDKIDIITIDVSFISVTKFLPDLIRFCGEDFDIIILVKPQFESEKGEVKKGVVTSREQHIRIMEKLTDHFTGHGFMISHFTFSPIKGPKGNVEFLVHLKKKGKGLSSKEIIEMIREKNFAEIR
ncbi:MAG: TlyA family RNA methyltransferase [bacterium]|nr:TlyA family RNA methyltransferase [bacterium]